MKSQLTEECLAKWFLYLGALKQKHCGIIQEQDPDKFHPTEKALGLKKKFKGEIAPGLFYEEEKFEFIFQSGEWSVIQSGKQVKPVIPEEDYEQSNYSLVDTGTAEILFQYNSKINHLPGTDEYSISLMVLEELVIDTEKALADCKRLSALLQTLAKRFSACKINS